MTRFLARALSDPQFTGRNQETQRLFDYHQATKHTYDSVRANAHFLDWRNQPNPFRTYEGAALVSLPTDPGFPEAGTFEVMGSLAGDTREAGEKFTTVREPAKLDTVGLSRLLWHSMAVSAWKKAPGSGSRYSLRVNPSSGNLHPTETYLALRGFAGLGDGLYHYRADLHALERRSEGEWTGRLAHALQLSPATEASLIVGLTSIFWREAWKYRDRAYRYSCHDLGHAMMSILLAAQALGLPGGAMAHFSDSRMSRLLGLADGDEAPMAYLVFPAEKHSLRASTADFVPPEEFAGEPNVLSAEEVSYKLLLEMHASTILPEPAGPPPHASRAPSAEDVAGDAPIKPNENLREAERDRNLGMITRRRRSALDFDPRTAPMPRADLEQLLDFATRDWRADWRGTFAGGEVSAAGRGADFVTLYLFVHRVQGCEPGVYRWDQNARELRQLHQGNVQRVAAFLSLEQNLAGNSCFTVSMVADLAAAARTFGNRGYRYVYFEAGAIGQRLYIGAEALGWNATGIGAFYDDDVQRYLGFLAEHDGSVNDSVNQAEHSSLVMLDSPASRHAADEKQKPTQLTSAPAGAENPKLPEQRQSAEEKSKTELPSDSSRLPRQVIYHFAVGRAVPDPRIED